MASLTGNTIASTYSYLLKLEGTETPLDTDLQTVEDGVGTDSALRISTDQVKSTGTLTVTGAATLSTSVTLATGATVTGIDNGGLATGSATLLATQGAIKTYVDAQVAATNELSEVLAAGNTTGANNISVNVDQKITTDTIDETTTDAGVTVEGVILKDSEITSGEWKATVVADEYGGTGQTTYTQGDILVATGADTLSKLTKGAANSILTSGATDVTWATSFTGNVTGTASKVTVTDSAVDTAFPVVFNDESDALLDDTAAFTYNPSSSTVSATAFVGNLTGDVTGDLTGNVTATSTLADGVTATTQAASDNSTKVATTAYVDAQVETSDTLSEVLGNGNTTGAYNISVNSGQSVIFVGATNDVTLSASDQTSGDGVATIPDLAGVDGDIVVSNATQTLTNKTLTTPVISSISNSGTITLPTSTDTLVGRATTDTLTNKTLTTPVITSISNSGTITIPTGTDTLVGRATTDTLTNKTLTSPVLTTPQVNDTSADHQYVVAVSELAADRTVTLPLLAGNDEFTFNDHTQTLTNKTIDASSNTLSNIANTSLTNSSVSYGGVSVSLGASDPTPAFDLADATNYEGTAIKSSGESGGTKVLTEDGSGGAAWVAPAGGSGTVTSITPAADAGTGTAITGSGTLTNTGGTGIDTSVTGTTTTFALDLNELTDVSGTDSNGWGSGDTIAIVDSGDSSSKRIMPPAEIGIACSDETTAIDAIGIKATIMIPRKMKLTEVKVSLTTKDTTGLQVQLEDRGTDPSASGTEILAAVINTSTNYYATSTSFNTSWTSATSDILDANDFVTVEVENAGDGASKGMKVWLLGYWA